MKRHIPNIVTGLNLLTGSIAVAVAFQDVVLASWLILIAAFLDFLDGFLARLLNAYSEFGHQFDSLADIVSFGMAPSVLMYLLLQDSNPLPVLNFGDLNMVPFISMLLALFAGIRLTVFTLRKENKTFSGLPTPATAILMASLTLMLKGHEAGGTFGQVMFNSWFLIGFIIAISILMVIPIKMISLKKSIRQWFKAPEIIILLLGAMFLVIFLGYTGIALTILLYVLISLVLNFRM